MDMQTDSTKLSTKFSQTVGQQSCAATKWGMLSRATCPGVTGQLAGKHKLPKIRAS
jgi:hypothetical protein